MLPMRVSRILLPAAVMVGLAGLGPGCSGEAPPPPDKETSKKIASDMKSARQEIKSERVEAKKEQRADMKEVMKGRMRGRGGR
jgi:hypothetical protein